MIDFLRGVVFHVTTRGVVVETGGGIGYEILLVGGSSPRLEEEIILYIHEMVRDEVRTWYGFPTRLLRDCFRQLLQAHGVGPKAACLILERSTVSQLAQAIHDGDHAFFERVPGIGRKTAQRIILELQDRRSVFTEIGVSSESPGVISPEGIPRQMMGEEVIAALQSLGYNKREATGAVQSTSLPVSMSDEGRSWLRRALQLLGSK